MTPRIKCPLVCGAGCQERCIPGLKEMVVWEVRQWLYQEPQAHCRSSPLAWFYTVLTFAEVETGSVLSQDDTAGLLLPVHAMA